MLQKTHGKTANATVSVRMVSLVRRHRLQYRATPFRSRQPARKFVRAAGGSSHYNPRPKRLSIQCTLVGNKMKNLETICTYSKEMLASG